MQEALRSTWSLKLDEGILYLDVMSWIGASKAGEEGFIIEFAHGDEAEQYWGCV